MMRRFAAHWAPLLVQWRWQVVAFWVVAIALAASSLGGLERLTKEDDGARTSSSAHAHELMRAKFAADALTELGLVYEGPVTPAYRASVAEALRKVPGVALVRPVALAGHPGLALDRAALTAGMDDHTAQETSRRLMAALAAVPAPPGVKAHLMGRPVLIQELSDLNASEVKRVERFSLLLSFIVLVVVFGSLAAALLPVAMGLAGITLTLGVVVALGGAVPVSALTRLVTSVIAIAVGIDYALFVVSRYREERASGRDATDAITRTLAHAGGTITLSALVMGCSVLALLIPDFSGARAIAGCVTIVLGVSLLTTFSLLPALLILADRWVASEQAQRHERARQAGTWSSLARWVLGHHKQVLVGTAALLGLLIIQLGHMRLWEPGPTLLPTSLSSRQGYDVLAKAGLGGEIDSLFVVVQQPPGDRTLAPATLEAMAGLRARLKADPRIARVDSILDLVADDAGHRDRFFAQLDDPFGRMLLMPRLTSALKHDAEGTFTIMRVIPRQGLASPFLRDLVIDIQHRQLMAPPGVQLFLGGNAARRVDFTTALYSQMPLMGGLVVGSIYLLLLVYFRSLLLPLKAVVMNAVPVMGACGVLVLVFQDGWGAGLLGLDGPPGAVMAMTPIVLFCLVFGLSMDYEVLILSRVREAHLAGCNDDEAIRMGMSSTGGIITGAAAIMLSVFAPNLASALVNAKELGLGLSTAVLIDATAIRLLLVPAFMKAMGSWNWYFPGRSR
ncbi:MAG: family transporter [Cyanobacteria bacterium RYN_339]|nr:family transporter [Cyanobacteria bacterium RYN_339]